MFLTAMALFDLVFLPRNPVGSWMSNGPTLVWRLVCVTVTKKPQACWLATGLTSTHSQECLSVHQLERRELVDRQKHNPYCLFNPPKPLKAISGYISQSNILYHKKKTSCCFFVFPFASHLLKVSIIYHPINRLECLAPLFGLWKQRTKVFPNYPVHFLGHFGPHLYGLFKYHLEIHHFVLQIVKLKATPFSCYNT